jgi:hypothetical protein
MSDATSKESEVALFGWNIGDPDGLKLSDTKEGRGWSVGDERDDCCTKLTTSCKK